MSKITFVRKDGTRGEEKVANINEARIFMLKNKNIQTLYFFNEHGNYAHSWTRSFGRMQSLT